jgi:8-oxo-dGTP diphosphatase
MRLPIVNVAVSIVRAPDGRVLLAERTPRQIAAGFWELPGGKIDPGETPEQAAARELHEEIGIRPQSMRRWISYEHAFKTKRVRLHFFQVNGYDGTPHGREGQRLAWVNPAAPSVAPVLPSNNRVLHALALPRIAYIVDPSHHGGPHGLLAHLEAILSATPLLLVLDADSGAPDQRISLARRVEALARNYGAETLLAGSPMEAQRAGLNGMLSSASDLRRLTARPQLRLWAASCHTEADVARAASLGADVVFLSPILPTPAHPGQALGWETLKRLAASAPMPIFARGGLTASLLDQALEAGAAGIAVSHLDESLDPRRATMAALTRPH